MPLTITPERYLAIRRSVGQRRSEELAAEIDTATTWDDQPRFADVDDFLKIADTAVEQSPDPSRRSAKHP
jgi:hypothetical protein